MACINDLPNELLLKICRLCSIPDTDINGNNPIAPLSLSSQTLFVNKNFCDAGRSILYGENTFIFTDFLMLEDFTQRIGSKAAENITKLTFTDNVNAVYAAQDFEVYPKLNTIRIILPYKDIPLNLHNPQHAVLFQGMAPQTVITLHPLPQRLYPGHCIPDQYDALFPNMLHFFATRIIQSIRDGELRVELVCRHRRRDRMNLHNWRTRRDFYIVRPVQKGGGIKGSMIKRNHDMVYFRSEYEYDPATHGY